MVVSSETHAIGHLVDDESKRTVSPCSSPEIESMDTPSNRQCLEVFKEDTAEKEWFHEDRIESSGRSSSSRSSVSTQQNAIGTSPQTRLTKHRIPTPLVRLHLATTTSQRSRISRRHSRPSRSSRRRSRGGPGLRSTSVQDLMDSSILGSQLTRENSERSRAPSPLTFEKRKVMTREGSVSSLARTMSNFQMGERVDDIEYRRSERTERAERMLARQVIQEMRGNIKVESDEEVDDVGIEMIRRRRRNGIPVVPPTLPPITTFQPIIKTIIEPPTPTIHNMTTQTVEMVLEEIRAMEMAGSLTDTEVSFNEEELAKFEMVVPAGIIPIAQPYPIINFSHPSIQVHQPFFHPLTAEIEDYAGSPLPQDFYPPGTPTSPCHMIATFAHRASPHIDCEEDRGSLVLGAIVEESLEETVDVFSSASATIAPTPTSISTPTQTSESCSESGKEPNSHSEQDPKTLVQSLLGFGSLTLKGASAVLVRKFSFQGSLRRKSSLAKEEETITEIADSPSTTASRHKLITDPLPGGSLGWFIPKSEWKQNHRSVICDYNLCDTPFSSFVRRHHCRMCGLIFCRDHSSHSLLLAIPSYIDIEPENRLRQERVCQGCWDDVYNPGKGDHRTKWPKQSQELEPSTPEIETELTHASTPAGKRCGSLRNRMTLGRYNTDPGLSGSRVLGPPRSPSSTEAQRIQSVVTGALASYPLAACRSDGSISSSLSPSPGSLVRSNSNHSTTSLMDLGRSNASQDSKGSEFAHAQWGYTREIFDTDAESDEELEDVLLDDKDCLRMRGRRHLIVDGPISYTVNAPPRQGIQTFTWPPVEATF